MLSLLVLSGRSSEGGNGSERESPETDPHADTEAEAEAAVDKEGGFDDWEGDRMIMIMMMKMMLLHLWITTTTTIMMMKKGGEWVDGKMSRR